MNRLLLRSLPTVALLFSCYGHHATDPGTGEEPLLERPATADRPSTLSERKAQQWQAAAAAARAQAETRYLARSGSPGSDAGPAAGGPAQVQVPRAVIEPPAAALTPAAPQARPTTPEPEVERGPEAVDTAAVQPQEVDKSAAEERADKRWRSLQERRTRSLEYSEIADF